MKRVGGTSWLTADWMTDTFMAQWEWWGDTAAIFVYYFTDLKASLSQKAADSIKAENILVIIQIFVVMQNIKH